MFRIDRAGPAPIVETKGDANAAADPWHAELHGGVAWRLRSVIPKLGYLVIAFRSRAVHLFSLFVFPPMLCVWALVRIWRPGSGSEPLGEGGAPPAAQELSRAA